ncbi:cell envelope integrity protein TolA, partial [Salmonella enterica]|uniref:cell envelope integrity protein TolA n=1 Tax=Salmonella enterica TaxID=28901 RepID=UPI001FAE971A
DIDQVKQLLTTIIESDDRILKDREMTVRLNELGQPSKDSGTSGANGGATGADISAYAKQIQVAIQSRLYDASLYQGKQCVLHISLAPDGSLKSITSEGGDPALCQAALMAAKTAKIPKPPSQAVYEKIKDAKLDFKL